MINSKKALILSLVLPIFALAALVDFEAGFLVAFLVTFEVAVVVLVAAVGLAGSALAVAFFFLLARLGNRSFAAGLILSNFSRTAVLKGDDAKATAIWCTTEKNSTPLDLAMVRSKPGTRPFAASSSVTIPST